MASEKSEKEIFPYDFTSKNLKAFATFLNFSSILSHKTYKQSVKVRFPVPAPVPDNEID